MKQLLTKYQFFLKLSQISHIRKNHNFSSIIGRSYTNCFYPINFMAGICEEYSFLFLPVVSRLTAERKEEKEYSLHVSAIKYIG